MKMISKIRFVSITVTDIDQALDFYIEKLGFKVARQMPLSGGNQFVMVAPPDGGAHLVFSLPMPGRAHTPSSAISFETADANTTCAELTAKGVEFTRLPSRTSWGGWEAAFVDPSGNSFMLHEGGL
jgi:catechol 2,3-dioxygenase-like lactoylglutathione lyase family enzyme